MKIGHVEQYLMSLYKAGKVNSGRLAPLLLGPPGIGKSQTIKALAKKLAKALNKRFIEYTDDEAHHILSEPDKYFVFCDFRLTECEPSDLMGIPREQDGAMRYSPLLWAKCLSVSAGILLLDELTNVSRPDVITATYKLIFDRRAGFTSFHPDVLIICCGNRPEESSVANLLPTPLLSRVLILDISPSSVDDWAKWMDDTYGDEWDRRVYVFHKRFETENYLIQVPKTPEGLDAYSVPRTNTYLALLLHRGIGDSETFKGLVGDEIGIKLQAFLKVNVDLELLIREPMLFKQLDADQRYMVALMLASWINQNIKKMENSFRLIEAMSEQSNEYVVITLKCMGKKHMVDYLKTLFKEKPQFQDLLKELVSIKEDIKA